MSYCSPAMSALTSLDSSARKNLRKLVAERANLKVRKAEIDAELAKWYAHRVEIGKMIAAESNRPAPRKSASPFAAALSPRNS